MSIKDIFSELKEERKQRKLDMKNKKKNLTKDEKNHKIFGILLGSFVLFGCLFTACNAMSCNGGFAWNEIIGLSNETIDELKVTVDESEILFEDTIDESDWSECVSVLKNAGIDLFEREEINKEKLNGNIVPTSDFVLSGNLIGALYNNLLFIYNYSSQFKVLNYKIYGDMSSNRKGEAESVIYINLSEILNVDNLPDVYVHSYSKIEILNENLRTLDSEIKINKLSDKSMEEISNIINRTELNSLSTFGNDMINECLKYFAETLNMKIKIINNGVQFYK